MHAGEENAARRQLCSHRKALIPVIYRLTLLSMLVHCNGRYTAAKGKQSKQEQDPLLGTAVLVHMAAANLEGCHRLLHCWCRILPPAHSVGLLLCSGTEMGCNNHKVHHLSLQSLEWGRHSKRCWGRAPVVNLQEMHLL